MAKAKSRSNPRKQRDLYTIANRPKVVGSISNITKGDVDWFYSPEESLRRRAKLQGLVQRRKLYRRAALGAVLLMSEDRRRFEPTQPGKLSKTRADRPARMLSGSPRHRLLVKPLKPPRSGRSRAQTTPIADRTAVRFAQPSKVAICVRRRIRKEVIFAVGKSGSKAGRRRRSYFSGVSCA